MPQGDARRLPPRAYCADGVWPEALMTDHHGAKVAQALAVRLKAAIEARGWSVAELSRVSGVARYTIAKALAGEAWPDLLTIANLEKALGEDLWPGRDV
ncbi:multiprotein-bridging factor 1 family protein [Streptomyces sp. NPDC017988]|uniref:multiprotein-bridging factor 1 family protein n=1 Tax=Streptomyces sp. NPDC017988 TaxID=3365025 RepID=UPI003793B4A2